MGRKIWNLEWAERKEGGRAKKWTGFSTEGQFHGTVVKYQNNQVRFLFLVRKISHVCALHWIRTNSGEVPFFYETEHCLAHKSSEKKGEGAPISYSACKKERRWHRRRRKLQVRKFCSNIGACTRLKSWAHLVLLSHKKAIVKNKPISWSEICDWCLPSLLQLQRQIDFFPRGVFCLFFPDPPKTPRFAKKAPYKRERKTERVFR